MKTATIKYTDNLKQNVHFLKLSVHFPWLFFPSSLLIFHWCFCPGAVLLPPSPVFPSMMKVPRLTCLQRICLPPGSGIFISYSTHFFFLDANHFSVLCFYLFFAFVSQHPVSTWSFCVVLMHAHLYQGLTFTSLYSTNMWFSFSFLSTVASLSFPILHFLEVWILS